MFNLNTNTRAINQRSKYFDFNDVFIKTITFYLIVGMRNIGKTTNAINWLFNNGFSPIVYLRRFDSEIQEYIKALKNTNWFRDEKYSIKDRILYDKDGNKLILFISLTTYYAKTSGNFDDYNGLVFDEIVSRTFYINKGKEFKMFMDLLMTIKRERKDFMTILLANAVDGNNLYCNTLNVDISSNKQQIIENEDKTWGMVAWIIPPQLYENDKFNKESDEYNLAGFDDETFSYMFKNRFNNNMILTYYDKIDSYEIIENYRVSGKVYTRIELPNGLHILTKYKKNTEQTINLTLKESMYSDEVMYEKDDLVEFLIAMYSDIRNGLLKFNNLGIEQIIVDYMLKYINKIVWN